MRRLAASLALLAFAASCANTSSRQIRPRAPTLAERLQEKDTEGDGLPKRPAPPRWVAPPPAYGNRVVQAPLPGAQPPLTPEAQAALTWQPQG